MLGVRYLTDARATQWFDPEMKKIQEQVDALLPGTVNLLDCGQCDQRERVLVTSYADRQPATYRLFSGKTGTLAPITDSRPWIKPKTMAARDMVRIDARDGESMPVHVTRPNGQKTPLPTVVLVHGGPFVRGGEWEWDAESQFLASRGYVVVEPEFRGSTGFGFKHFRAGWKQWGLAMQDDVADAALWAVKQGYADPKRICIAGASYGGYATLMGLANDPDLFKCGVNWVGVTDIDLMYSIHWSDSSDVWKRYGMPRLVGDRKRDAEQLAATSPVKLASKLTQPLLMAYGGVDVRVPIDHGTIFRDAVRKTNKDVEWVAYPEEGHGWLLPANNVDFWTRVERFLDKNLKNAP
jgi:dipeptidyl aminopeptidase/acylaminoacyl peptidase